MRWHFILKLVKSLLMLDISFNFFECIQEEKLTLKIVKDF